MQNLVAERPYILYTIPWSRTTQALRGRKIEKAWDNIKAFLNTCTTANVDEPKSICLNVFSACERYGELAAPADLILEKTKNVFGTGVTRPVGMLVPGNIPTPETETAWELTTNDLEKAINYMIQGQPWPKYNLGPIELILSYNFNLIDPPTKVTLPNQQFTSSILVCLSRRNYISPSLCFPFSEANKEFWDYANSIEAFLPFKLERKYLRLGRSNKKGTSNLFSKL